MQPLVRFNVPRLLADAVRATWRERRPIARGLALPLVASVLLLLATLNLRGSQPILRELAQFVALLPYAAFAVACHRAILNQHFARLGPAENRAAALRFIALFILVSVVLSAVPFPFPLLSAAPVNRALGLLAFGVLCAVIVYATARFSLLFPMLAVDAARNPWVSWDLTVGNGWRIAFAAGLPFLVLTILAMGTFEVVFRCFPRELEIDFRSPLTLGILGSVALALIYATTAIQAAILSLLFLTLHRHRPVAA